MGLLQEMLGQAALGQVKGGSLGGPERNFVVATDGKQLIAEPVADGALAEQVVSEVNVPAEVIKARDANEALGRGLDLILETTKK